MNSIDLSILPEAVEDIVHKYQHQMKYSSVMDELSFVSKTLQQKCGCCRDEFVSFVRCECINEQCNHTFCGECQKEEIKRRYEDFMMDATEEEMQELDMEDFVEEVLEDMECGMCIYMRHQWEHTQEDYDDDYFGDDYNDRYGYYGGW